MKVFCENCMGENEVDVNQAKINGYRAACQTCGHMIFMDTDAVEAALLRKNPIPANLIEKLESSLDSVAQSNTTTTIAARIDVPRAETSAAVFTVLDGPDLGLEFTMDSPRLVLGRRGADINLNDRLVSRRHLSIEASGGRYLIKDMGSTNGTFLNGTPVSMEFIKHGDEIQIGSTLMKFRIKSMDTSVIVLDK